MPRFHRLLAPLLGSAALVLACTPPPEVPEHPTPPATGVRAGDVVYGVVPGLWGGGDGHAARAVRSRLDHIERLGATVLWLWPPAQPRAWGEEYGVTGFRGVDESWGSTRQLRSLVDAAHDRGLRVITDVVVNHTSNEHRWYTAEPERYETGDAAYYFDWSHLPNLELDDPAVRAAVGAGLSWWVEEIGVDGFRFDVAWGPARRSPDFWPEVVTRLRGLDPDLLLLAEAGPQPWVADAGFDLAYDWRGGLGRSAWEDVWRASAPAEVLARRLGAPAPVPILRFLDNNDTGRRFATRYGLGLAARAAVVELTVPGVPTVFAGQELGIAFEPYSVGEEPPAWRDRGLLDLYRRLVHLRRDELALSGPDLEVVAARGARLTYVRPGERPVVVAVDLAPGATAVPRRPRVAEGPPVVAGPGYAVWLG